MGVTDGREGRSPKESNTKPRRPKEIGEARLVETIVLCSGGFTESDEGCTSSEVNALVSSSSQTQTPPIPLTLLKRPPLMLEIFIFNQPLFQMFAALHL